MGGDRLCRRGDAWGARHPRPARAQVVPRRQAGPAQAPAPDRAGRRHPAYAGDGSDQAGGATPDDTGTALTAEFPSYAKRLRQLAALNPDGLALIFSAEDGSEREISWRELDERSTQVARALEADGLGRGDRLAIGLRNSPEHLFAAFGGWKLGSVVVPLRWDLPEWELARVQQVLQPTVNLHRGDMSLFDRSLSCSTEPLPDVTPPKARGICSSGSTGSPKIIVVERPGVVNPATISNTSAMIESYGPMPHPQLVLVPGPLYHTVGFSATNHLLAGDSVVLLERFDAA